MGRMQAENLYNGAEVDGLSFFLLAARAVRPTSPPSATPQQTAEDVHMTS